MLKSNPLKAALKQGKPIVGTMVSEVRSPGFIWMLAHAGFDFVFIDMEHGTYDLATASDLIKVARLAGIAPLVRVPDLAYHVIAQALDAGAMGLMLPRVETRAQAEEFVSYMKYPPVGVRGGTTYRGHTDYGGASPQELVRHMNDNLLAILQIERKRAIENIDDLLSVPGVDVGLIGPFDLAISLEVDSTGAPEVSAAIQKVVDAGKRHGTATGIHIHDPKVVLDWHKQGMSVLACNTDLGFFSAAAQSTAAALREGAGLGSSNGKVAEAIQV